jgi:hypothetical protein
MSSALVQLNEAFMRGVRGRIMPDSLTVSPELYARAFDEQRWSCREHHYCDAFVRNGEEREHFLFKGVPVFPGRVDVIVLMHAILPGGVVRWPTFRGACEADALIGAWPWLAARGARISHWETFDVVVA